jgi:hypothetical protein
MTPERLPLAAPASPFVDSTCKFMRLAGRNFAHLIGLDYQPNRPALHRMLAQLQGWSRTWICDAAKGFAPYYDCDSKTLEDFLVGAGPAPNAACAAAAEYSFTAASELTPVFVSAEGFLRCGTILSVSTAVPPLLLPETPRQKVFEARRSLAPKAQRAQLDGMEALAEAQHEALLATFPSHHHFVISGASLSAMLRREVPFDTFDDADVIDVLGFLLNDICLGGRGQISFSNPLQIPLKDALPLIHGFRHVLRLGDGQIVVEAEGGLLGFAKVAGARRGSLVDRQYQLLTQIHAMHLAQGYPSQAIRLLERLLQRARR